MAGLAGLAAMPAPPRGSTTGGAAVVVAAVVVTMMMATRCRCERWQQPHYYCRQPR